MESNLLKHRCKAIPSLSVVAMVLLAEPLQALALQRIVFIRQSCQIANLVVWSGPSHLNSNVVLMNPIHRFCEP
ncbi:MAG TPA: hypothetical protein DEF45_00915 [Rhodopirellula sp.]|nr:MAG: hypothetical protein CBD74_07375 [Saprospirales bacterium TMED214]HBV61560.1 hypothetical protein [Rhodopirellula sp.]